MILPENLQVQLSTNSQSLCVLIYHPQADSPVGSPGVTTLPCNLSVLSHGAECWQWPEAIPHYMGFPWHTHTHTLMIASWS